MNLSNDLNRATAMNCQPLLLFPSVCELTVLLADRSLPQSPGGSFHPLAIHPSSPAPLPFHQTQCPHKGNYLVARQTTTKGVIRSWTNLLPFAADYSALPALLFSRVFSWQARCKSCLPPSLDYRKSTLARGSRWDYKPLPF